MVLLILKVKQATEMNMKAIVVLIIMEATVLVMIAGTSISNHGKEKQRAHRSPTRREHLGHQGGTFTNF